jgi:hypothetical protein
MKLHKLLMVTAVAVTLSVPAMAQTDTSATDTPAAATDTTTPPAQHDPRVPNAGSETQRDVNQQGRIEQGLDSGALTTHEASKLEKGESRIDAVEAKDMKDGTLSAKDRAQIQHMQNQESQRIYDQKHDNQTGNPNSASSQRMQADVQRDANQEQRVHNGVTNGTLTNHEAGKLEGGQARNDRAQWRAGRDGKISALGQRRLQHQENQTSRGTWRKKHNGRNRKAG